MNRVIIIGGGPIGLYLAKKLEENNLSYLLLEASEILGGQLSMIYPEKVIADLKEYKPLLAKHYVEEAIRQINLENVVLNEEVISIDVKENHVEVKSKNEHVYLGEYVIIATGLGFYKQKPLGLENEHLYENILYYLKDYHFLENKRVAIFGGGDSALDWAKQISQVTNYITLIHRRSEFRGNINTIRNINSIDIKTPYIPESLISEDNKLIGVKIKNIEDNSLLELEVDYVLVNFGSLPTKVSFDVPTSNRGVLCDEYRCVKNRIYVAGDAIGNEGKIKRIEDGYKDVHLILKTLFNV